MNRKRRPRPSKRRKLFSRWHGCGSRGSSRQDHCLSNMRKRKLLLQRCSSCGERRHPWSYVEWNAQTLQPSRLLGQRTPNRQVSRMNARNINTLVISIANLSDNLIKIHLGGVYHPSSSRSMLKNLLRHQRPGIQTHWRVTYMITASHRDQISGSRSRAHKVHHHASTPAHMTATAHVQRRPFVFGITSCASGPNDASAAASATFAVRVVASAREDCVVTALMRANSAAGNTCSLSPSFSATSPPIQARRSSVARIAPDGTRSTTSRMRSRMSSLVARVEHPNPIANPSSTLECIMASSPSTA